VAFEGPTRVTMRITVFRNMTPCILVRTDVSDNLLIAAGMGAWTGSILLRTGAGGGLL
jgi:hypothetical protein